ncbi:hypothetical protein MMAD_08090 [Mycolicibacterium madagascariense]|uniref:PE-PGRS family protein n=1 Tax=Mycolicibacterium madagascariense TaxID=212765 RepID=A0A7I7XAC3_9MYCO|nr:hypothetical protein [Mycolicibacterium madagascariense]MCV7014803.1 hypothetical protein [Mycolicibacterium madagascariense]BBZ26514.1 hypothetical protein MMAD_08090 [Mycolicibacterium madagascariense]
MSIAVRPHTRFAAALVAAGVVSAASVVGLPEHRSVSIDVANASAITDVLSSFGKGVEVASSLVGIHVDAVVSLPFEASLAVLAAAQHPELGSSILSYLVQRFVNPSIGAPFVAYPFETEQAVSLLGSLLPQPLPGLVDQAGKDFATAFDDVLKHLGNPVPGYDAVQAVMNDTVLGGVVEAGQLAVRAPIYAGWNTVNYLGNLPVNVEASVESAIAKPGHIPGLASNLVYGLLSPNADVGLFGQLLNNAVDPFTWLPAPIGYSAAAPGLANQFRDAVTQVVNHVLSMLPTPVTPAALSTPTAATGQPTYSVGAAKGAIAQEPKKANATTIVKAEKPSKTKASKAKAKPTHAKPKPRHAKPTKSRAPSAASA